MNLQRRPVKLLATLVLLVAFAVTAYGTQLGIDSAAAPEGIITLELARAPADAAAVLRSWRRAGGEAAIDAARASIRWDNLFIPCYVALYLTLCLWSAGRLQRRVPRPLLALPVLAGLLDYLENWGMSAMLAGAPTERWSKVVAPAASAKFFFLGLTTIFIFMNVPFLLRRADRPGRQGLLALLAAAWRPFSGPVHVAKVCRWSALGVAVALLLLTEPGRDLFRGLDRPGDARWWLFLVAALLWATNVWYWGRALLSLKMPGPVDPVRIQRWATWVPRGLGCLGLLLLATAIGLAARNTQGASHATLILWSRVMIAAAIAFLAVVTWRRAAGRSMRIDMPQEPDVHRHEDATSLPMASKRFLAGLLGAALLLLALFWISPQWGPRFGTITIALLAASLWIPLGSVLTYVALTRRVPAISLLVVWALAISPLTDNRRLSTQPRQLAASRPPLAGYLDRRLASLPAAEGVRRPVYLVTAEGGGIRAAYWAATVLGRLQDKQPRFGNHLAGISSVSGGSVGAAVFLGLLADGATAARVVAENAPPERTAGCEAARSPLRCAARAILSHDYLAANLASLLFPDLLQRFVPFSLPGTDRAKAFEASWQAEWSLRTGNERMSQPLEQLWGGDVLASPLPPLFLNSTQVETGLRAVLSPVRLPIARVPDLIDGLDALSTSEPATISLATAAHASSRFPYVSPAGRVPGGHLVDGGYFENSGAATGLELLSALNRREVQPIVIAIINSLDAPAPKPDRWANDLLAPPLTLFRTRDARAVHSESVLERAVRQQGGCMVRVPRERGAIEPPLSWVLSASSQNELDRQLDSLEARFEAALAPLSGGASPCPP